ncbi:hypothetical protein GFV12_01205 [Desulfurobacterium thermolithotrophum]
MERVILHIQKQEARKKLDYTFMRKQNKNSSLCMDCHRENAAPWNEPPYT